MLKQVIIYRIEEETTAEVFRDVDGPYPFFANDHCCGCGDHGATEVYESKAQGRWGLCAGCAIAAEKMTL